MKEINAKEKKSAVDALENELGGLWNYFNENEITIDTKNSKIIVRPVLVGDGKRIEYEVHVGVKGEGATYSVRVDGDLYNLMRVASNGSTTKTFKKNVEKIGKYISKAVEDLVDIHNMFRSERARSEFFSDVGKEY